MKLSATFRKPAPTSIYDRIGGYEAIEVVVYRVRKKLAGTGVVLMTLRGLGYLLKAEA